MATHAHSTRTPLLRLSDKRRVRSSAGACSSPQPLLGQGLGRQLGPVTQAIRAMRAAEPLPPADVAIEAIREGLIRYFVEDDGTDRQRIRELRRRIADRIEADLALLDALDPDPEAEPSLGATEVLALCGPGAAEAKARQRYDWDDQTHWGRSDATDGERDAGEEPEEENEHGGDILDEPHDPQPDDVLPRMHGWDPRVADSARAACRQAEAMRARKDRGMRL